MTGILATEIRLTKVNSNLVTASMKLDMMSSSYVVPVKPSAKEVF